MKFSKIRIVVSLLTIVILVIGLVIGIILLKQKQETRSHASGEIVFNDNFNSDISSWTNSSETSSLNTITIDNSIKYEGSGSVKFNFADGAHAVKLEKNIGISTNIVARVFYYDDLTTSMGTSFGLKEVQGSSNFVALGVKTDQYAGDYYMRINSASSRDYYDTYVKRFRGWHMFEIIVTPSGTYAKIDNRLIRSGDSNLSDPPRYNPSLTSASVVELVSTWRLTGVSYYDDFSVARVDTTLWSLRPRAVLESYYQTWGNLDLNYILNNPTIGDGIIRSYFDHSTAIYVYGKAFNNEDAMQKGVNLFSGMVNNNAWNLSGRLMNVFPSGQTQAEFTYGAWLMWDRFDDTTKQNVKTIVHNEALNYINTGNMPISRHVGNTAAEENGASAYFLAGAANLFSDAFSDNERRQIEGRARCFAYHSITISADPEYCGIKTQTVYDDFRLDNHGDKTAIYAFAPIQQLGLGAMAYQVAGKPIPVEFQHNINHLYNNFIKPRVDINTYSLVDSLRDWCCGATDSFYYANAVLKYLRVLGTDPGFNEQDISNKQSLFFANIVSDWIPNSPPSQITTLWPSTIRGVDFSEFKKQDWDLTNDEKEEINAYNWFLDSNMATWTYAIPRGLFDGRLIQPNGYLEEATCTGGIKGWATERDDQGSPVRIDFWDYSKTPAVGIISTVANQYRSGLESICPNAQNGAGYCAFSVPYPNEFRNGTTYDLSGAAIDTKNQDLHVWLKVPGSNRSDVSPITIACATTPTPAPIPTPTPTPDASPTPIPSPSPLPSIEPSSSPSPSVEPTPTPTLTPATIANGYFVSWDVSTRNNSIPSQATAIGNPSDVISFDTTLPDSQDGTKILYTRFFYSNSTIHDVQKSIIYRTLIIESPTPTPSLSPSPSVEPTPIPSPSPLPSIEPSSSPSPSVEPTPIPSPSPSVSPSISPLPIINIADINHDGKVDLDDYTILVEDFGPRMPASGSPADINHDGKVDLDDFTMFVENYPRN